MNTMLMFFIEIPTICFETVIFILFVDKFIYKRNISKTKLIFLLCMFQIAHRCLLNNIGFPSVFISLLVDIFIINWGYKGLMRTKLFAIFLFYSISIVADVVSELIIALVYSVSGLTAPAWYPPLPAIIFSKIALVFSIKLVDKAIQSGNNLKDWLKFIPISVFIIFALVMVSPFNMEYKGDNQVTFLLVIVSLLAALINIFMIFVSQRNNKNAQLDYKEKVLEDDRKISKTYFQDMKKAYIKVEKLAHDMRQHFNYMEHIKDVGQIHSYIKKLQDRGFSKILTYTGNSDIDSILTSKQYESNALGIMIDVTATKLPDTIDWIDPVDISIILGNALSNAIEACEVSKGEIINISFKYDADWLGVTVKNPTNIIPKKKSNGIGLKSTKSRANHGYGLENITSSAEIYDGIVNYNYVDGLFILSVILQKKSAD